MLMIPFIQLYSCYLPFLHKHLAIYLLLVQDIMESGVPLEKTSLQGLYEFCYLEYSKNPYNINIMKLE